MQKRTLGRTGRDSTVVSFGTYAIGWLDQDEADDAIQLVLDHGVNHFDIAPTYGQAMERVAPWMPEIRNREIFVGAKTAIRDRGGAWRDVESIMRRMRTERFDLFQLHSVGTMDQLELATAPGGSLETLVEMREQGLTKWLGITGHGPEVAATILESLNRFDFDTVMFPLNPAASRDPEYRRDSEALLVECEARNIGVQTIKMIARGGWGDGGKETNTWYDPHREQDDIDRSLWWVLSQPVHTAPSCGDVDLLPKVLDAARRFVPLDTPQLDAVADSQRPPNPLPALAIPPAA
ncbi:MAG: aldo/keto reductase [Chloroflexi bacterium]|nr:aldo/keto reductase [Chloroflexota bacterium]